MEKPFMVTWIMVKKRPTLAGVLPMRGSPWPVPVTKEFQTENQLMSGVSESIKMIAPLVPVSVVVAQQMVQPPSIHYVSTWNGCGNMLLQELLGWISISPCLV